VHYCKIIHTKASTHKVSEFIQHVLHWILHDEQTDRQTYKDGRTAEAQKVADNSISCRQIICY